MAPDGFPDVWCWIKNLPPQVQWRCNSMSLCVCTSRTLQPSLNFSITKSLGSLNPCVNFSIVGDYQIPVSLWTSKSFQINSNIEQSIDEETIVLLFFDIINGVLKYGPSKKPLSFKFPTVNVQESFKDIFNLAFLTLTFIVCIYEAPQDLRKGCLETLKLQLTNSKTREASKMLARVLGSNLEELWMRSFSLAVTNWMTELQPHNSHHCFKMPSPFFSYAFSASGLWKVQLYCPIVAMSLEEPSAITRDDRLLFSLRYQQLEGVVQLAYKVIVRNNWIDVLVRVDNVRFDMKPLVSEVLMVERGCGSEEKHFPSRVSLQLVPALQTAVLSVSVSKSTDNPTQEISMEKAFEGSFDPPNTVGVSVSASERITMSMRPWRYEQSVYGNSACMNWFLHDGDNGREVFSTRPSKLKLFRPKAWFRDRYSGAYRPFTKQGGVIFAGDEYGESVWWKISASTAGKTMEWEIKGCVWLTYWPNNQSKLYTETRRLEFKELLHLPVPKLA